MTDTTLLEDKIFKSGIKKAKLIEALGLTYNGFRNKVENRSGFMADEIMVLCEMLNIGVKERDKIFFAKIVDKKTT